jgi:cytosine permease
MLPDYIAKAVSEPCFEPRTWYVNTAPSYAGIFLWIGFYQAIAAGTADRASTAVAIIALAVAGLLSFALYYYVPGMLGMKTGYPLYVVAVRRSAPRADT